MACHSNNQPDIKPSLYDSKISFHIDSFKVYTFKDNLYKFIFSPLAKQDKIWTIDDQIFELDLKTGHYFPLYEKYGYEFKDRINETNIWRDSINEDVYIGVRYHLFRFNMKEDTFYRYEISNVTTIYPMASKILLGTANGLYFLDRKNYKISKARNVPIDQRIEKLKCINQDSVLINSGQFTYNLKTLDYRTGDYKTFLYENQPTGDIYLNQLPRSIENNAYQAYPDHKVSWYYSKNIIYYKDSLNSLFEINSLPVANLLQLKADSKYLYLLCNQKFAVINKNYILKKVIPFHPDEHKYRRDSINEELRKFENYDLDTLIRYYMLLQNDSLISKSAEFVTILKNNTQSRFIYPSGRISIQDIEVGIKSDKIPADLKKFGLVGLCMFYTRAFKLDKVMLYSKYLQDSFPDFDYFQSRQILSCISKVEKAVTDLKKLNYSGDRYLFELANLKEQLVHCGWFGDTYFDFRIVEDVYKTLLAKYPGSEYADNAAYYLLNSYKRGSSSDMMYSDALKLIKKIRTFILKYPNSELLPEARIEIANLYRYSYDGETKNTNRLKLAYNEIEKIDLTKNVDSNLINICLNYKENLMKLIEQSKFELVISCNQKEINFGEDIEIRISLINKTSSQEKVMLYKSEPCFTSSVYATNQIEFVPQSNPSDTSSSVVIIAGKDSLLQGFILNKKARFWDNGRIGSYSLKPNVVYSVTVYTKERKYISNTLNIFINE